MSDLGLSNLEQENLALAKFNMIEQQIRPCEVNNPSVIDTLHAINRHEFVPKMYQNLAYADCQIPFTETQTMMKPLIEGKILQALNIKNTDDCLEVGTGTGYFTACLSSLAKTVHSIDIDIDILTLAKQRLSNQFHNITFGSNDAFKVMLAPLKYDAIIITAAAIELPENFKQALTVGGRLFVIEGKTPTMLAKLITRTSATEWITTPLFETEITPLLN